MNLTVSPICLSIFSPDGVNEFSQAIAQAQRFTQILRMNATAFWEIRELAGRLLEVRLHLHSSDNADPDALPCFLVFIVSAHADRRHAILPSESRLFVVNDTLWTARELIEQGRNDIPGLAVTRRWIKRKESPWDFV